MRAPASRICISKLSDRLDRGERERLRDEEEYNAEFRIVDTIVFSVGDTRTRSGCVAFDSQDRDFGERDRALALALRPHVGAVWREAESRRRAAELLAALDGTDNAGDGQAIVVHGADGRIDHATSEARRLLARWFGPSSGCLARGLEEWLRLARPGDRYTERRNGSVLVVEAVGHYTAHVREHASGVARLTPREGEILALVAEGKTNGQIAEQLWISGGTVRRHLEHAYAKLGVHTRTAAVRAARRDV